MKRKKEAWKELHKRFVVHNVNEQITPDTSTVPTSPREEDRDKRENERPQECTTPVDDERLTIDQDLIEDDAPRDSNRVGSPENQSTRYIDSRHGSQRIRENGEGIDGQPCQEPLASAPSDDEFDRLLDNIWGAVEKRFLHDIGHQCTGSKSSCPEAWIHFVDSSFWSEAAENVNEVELKIPERLVRWAFIQTPEFVPYTETNCHGFYVLEEAYSNEVIHQQGEQGPHVCICPKGIEVQPRNVWLMVIMIKLHLFPLLANTVNPATVRELSRLFKEDKSIIVSAVDILNQLYPFEDELDHAFSDPPLYSSSSQYSSLSSFHRDDICISFEEFRHYATISGVRDSIQDTISDAQERIRTWMPEHWSSVREQHRSFKARVAQQVKDV